MHAIEEYYRDLYSPSLAVLQTESLSVIPNLVTNAWNQSLFAPVVEADVKRSILYGIP